MTIVDGEPVYCFKKALLTIHAVAARYSTEDPPPLPLPRTSELPVFSDNVIPSLLIHLDIIDLTTSYPTFNLLSIFPDAHKEETVNALLAVAPPQGEKVKWTPKEGPVLTTEQAYILRAAAVDACNLIVETARNLSDGEIQARAADGSSLAWLKEITVPQVDAWIWAVAKDRADYRRLERFVLRNTPYF
ncbi:hypothetical protein EUX98_g4568 [Antrodiella citrinella]|uniref:Uncharacterized protein n=1 Tax=Antrodiella citrinella TaxID=2447956 RepID=A0A4S4MUK6_9APHY|nr:hypothetical protein EUX98_g4568 [Antrodiella citrinella]